MENYLTIFFVLCIYIYWELSNLNFKFCVPSYQKLNWILYESFKTCFYLFLKGYTIAVECSKEEFLKTIICFIFFSSLFFFLSIEYFNFEYFLFQIISSIFHAFCKLFIQTIQQRDHFFKNVPSIAYTFSIEYTFYFQ